jgi:hypothetical protein
MNQFQYFLFVGQNFFAMELFGTWCVHNSTQMIIFISACFVISFVFTSTHARALQ